MLSDRGKAENEAVCQCLVRCGEGVSIERIKKHVITFIPSGCGHSPTGCDGTQQLLRAPAGRLSPVLKHGRRAESRPSAPIATQDRNRTAPRRPSAVRRRRPALDPSQGLTPAGAAPRWLRGRAPAGACRPDGRAGPAQWRAWRLGRSANSIGTGQGWASSLVTIRRI